MIAQNAAAAHAASAGAPPTEPHDVHVQRLRARMARDVAVMLDVPVLHVTVGDDPARRYGGRPGHLITVHDPDDPTTVYLLVPEAGNGGIYLLLDECPACNGPAVPMITITHLADLGRYLAATRPVPPGAPDPDDNDDGRPPLPFECIGDRGHNRNCTLAQP